MQQRDLHGLHGEEPVRLQQTLAAGDQNRRLLSAASLRDRRAAGSVAGDMQRRSRPGPKGLGRQVSVSGSREAGDS